MFGGRTGGIFWVMQYIIALLTLIALLAACIRQPAAPVEQPATPAVPLATPVAPRPTPTVQNAFTPERIAAYDVLRARVDGALDIEAILGIAADELETQGPPRVIAERAGSGWRVRAELESWDGETITFYWWLTPSREVRVDDELPTGSSQYPTTRYLTPGLPPKAS